jgi:hypothetical protein
VSGHSGVGKHKKGRGPATRRKRSLDRVAAQLQAEHEKRKQRRRDHGRIG